MIFYTKLLNIGKGTIGHNEQDNDGMRFSVICSHTPAGTGSTYIVRVVSSTQALYDSWISSNSSRSKLSSSQADTLGKQLQPVQTVTDPSGANVSVQAFDINNFL